MAKKTPVYSYRITPSKGYKNMKTQKEYQERKGWLPPSVKKRIEKKIYKKGEG